MNPLKAIRAKCLACIGTHKGVRYCPGDGVHSTRCELWPFRFGIRPTTAAKKHGQQFVTPRDMPEADISVEDLP